LVGNSAFANFFAKTTKPEQLVWWKKMFLNFFFS